MSYPFPNLSGRSLRIDKKFRPTLCWACNYLSTLWLQSNHISEKCPGQMPFKKSFTLCNKLSKQQNGHSSDCNTFFEISPDVEKQ